MPRAVVLNVSRPRFPAASLTAGMFLKPSLQVMDVGLKADTQRDVH